MLIVELSDDFKQHIKDQALAKGLVVSKYVRAALAKVSKYKPKKIV